MQISEIKEERKDQKILITYKLSEADCLLEFKLPDEQINFRKFCNNYLRIEDPFKFYSLIPAKSGFIKIEKFKELRMKMETQNQIIFQEISKNLKFIEKDLRCRLINRNCFSLHSEFDMDNDLRSRMERIENRIKQTVQNSDPPYYLYVLQTQILNEEGKQIVKVGRSSQSIEDNINRLRKQYENKIEFKVLFAQHIENKMDTKKIHNILLKTNPESKVYLENSQEKLHYGFYILTKEFVDSFESLLQELINPKIQQESEINESEIILQMDFPEQPYLLQNQEEEKSSFSLILPDIQSVNHEQNFQIQNESSLREEPKQLSENGSRLIFEARKMLRTPNEVFDALLFLTQFEREKVNDFYK